MNPIEEILVMAVSALIVCGLAAGWIFVLSLWWTENQGYNADYDHR